MLYLPEGEQDAANALVAFARMDGANRLLGGRAVAFDMRAPDRIYLRIPGRAAESAVAAAAKAKAKANAKLAQASGGKVPGPAHAAIAAPAAVSTAAPAFIHALSSPAASARQNQENE